MKSEQQQLKKETDAIGEKVKETAGKDTQNVMKKVLKSAAIPKEISGLSDAMVEGIYAQAYRLYNTGKYKDASQLFRLLIMLNSLEPKYPMGLAACFHMMKEYSAAGDIYAIVAMLDPSSPISYYHASDCFIQTGDPMSAIVALKMAVEKAGDQPAFKTLKDRALLTIDSLQKDINKTQDKK